MRKRSSKPRVDENVAAFEAVGRLTGGARPPGRKQPPAEELALAEKRGLLGHERAQLRAKLAQIEDKIRAFDLTRQDRQFLAFVRSPSPTSLGPTASTSDNGTTTPPTGLRAAIKAV